MWYRKKTSLKVVSQILQHRLVTRKADRYFTPISCLKKRNSHSLPFTCTVPLPFSIPHAFLIRQNKHTILAFFFIILTHTIAFAWGSYNCPSPSPLCSSSSNGDFQMLVLLQSSSYYFHVVIGSFSNRPLLRGTPEP